MIITVTGPSGIGKGYLISGLTSLFPAMREPTWLTTRPLRAGEETRPSRVNISLGEFQLLDKGGQIVLAQHIFGHYYGLVLDPGRFQNGIWITELHVENITRALNLGLPIHPIALIPADISFLRLRLEQYRATETQDEIEQRLIRAGEEIEWIIQNHERFIHTFTISQDNEIYIIEEVVAAIENIPEEVD